MEWKGLLEAELRILARSLRTSEVRRKDVLKASASDTFRWKHGIWFVRGLWMVGELLGRDKTKAWDGDSRT